MTQAGKPSHERGDKAALGSAAVIFSVENSKADIKPGFHPHSGSVDAIVMVLIFAKQTKPRSSKSHSGSCYDG